MNRYEFELHLSSEKFLDFYRGRARNVAVQCSTGQTVQFPANLLARICQPRRRARALRADLRCEQQADWAGAAGLARSERFRPAVDTD